MISSFFAPTKGSSTTKCGEPEEKIPMDSKAKAAAYRASPQKEGRETGASSPSVAVSKRQKLDNGENAFKIAGLAVNSGTAIENDGFSSSSSPKRKSVSGSSSNWSAAFESMEPSWKEAMAPYLSNRGKKDKLIAFLEQEQSSGKTVYPSADDVFSFMQTCPLHKVKVVVVGQDPYHGPGQAHGMCFSVQKGVQIPPSLKNMLKEAAQDANLQPKMKTTHNHGNLSSWCKQGVLLLNTCLTVRKAEPLSHKNKGWEDFTDQVILQCTKQDGIVYMCWGKEAQNKCAKVNTTRNLVISTSHPSPLGAYKTSTPFMGSKCFSKCNTWLEQKGKSAINFNLGA